MTHPNFLLITSDQQHWFTLGVENPDIQTPHLDRLCREGTRFSRAYCPNPTCTPTRATLLTGLMPSHHGAWTLGTKLQESVPCVGDEFRKAGYYTALVGKAHFQPLKSTETYASLESYPLLKDLEYWRKFTGPWYGFEHIEVARMHADEGHVGQHYALWMEEKGLKNWQDFYQDDMSNNQEKRESYTHGDTRHWDLPEEFHYSTWTAERTIASIDSARQQNRPFYVWSSFHDPHPPYIVPEPWASMYDPADMKPGAAVPGEHDRNAPHFRYGGGEPNDAFWDEKTKGQGAIHGAGYQADAEEDEVKKDMACYYGMISFMDEQIGRILDFLEEAGQAENTVVVFTSDHGHFLGQHGLYHKAIHHYEDLLRVPFLVRYPETVPANAVRSDLQNLVDLPRTFLQLAGLEAPIHYQGVDQCSSWRGEGPVREWSITENHHGYTRFHMDSFLTDRYKITVHRDSIHGELFDLQEDPAEIRNLWDDPDAADLKASLMHRFMRAKMESEPIHMPRVWGA
jgi:uncharacterized sulfatase